MTVEAVLLYYAFFCLTTAIYAMVRFFIPVVKYCRDFLEIKNEITTHPFIAYFVLFTISILSAPLLFIALLFKQKDFEMGFISQMLKG